MATAGLEVRLREGRERAEVKRFTRTIDEIVRSLREIDRAYLMRGTRATWVIADLSHDRGDMVVRLEARPATRRRTVEDMHVPVNALVDGAADLARTAAVPQLYSATTVERLAALAEPKLGVQEVSIATYNGRVGELVALSDDVRNHAREAVRPRESAYGSVAGVLDLVAAHHRRSGSLVRIYDSATKRVIGGTASEDLEEQLRGLWRHRVVAGGVLKRNDRGQVIRIEVDRLEPLPENDDLRPRTDELLGADPRWLGDHTVDQYLAEVRGA